MSWRADSATDVWRWHAVGLAAFVIAAIMYSVTKETMSPAKSSAGPSIYLFAKRKTPGTPRAVYSDSMAQVYVLCRALSDRVYVNLLCPTGSMAPR